MKLSHRDFRPQRRSRFVSRPPHKRPTLRILFLGLMGLAVYLKFDTVAKAVAGFQPKEWWAAFRQVPEPVAAVPLAQSWSADSLAVTLICPTLPDSCLALGFPLGAEAAGTTRATLAKIRIHWDFEGTRGFRAEYRKSSGELGSPAGWELERLDLQGTSGNLSLAKLAGADPVPLCAGPRCLQPEKPQTPLAAFRQVNGAGNPLDTTEHTPLASRYARFLPSSVASVRPVQLGRVISLPAEAGTEGWLKLHHGGDVFSWYRGFVRLATSVRVGGMVGPGDTLGWIGTRDDSLAGLDVRMESRGAELDVLAFLGLAETQTEAAHAR